jgi:hypothetical protein
MRWAGHVVLMGEDRGMYKVLVGKPEGKFAKKCKALQYCDSNEFIEQTVGTSRVLMSKAATKSICSNKHKA